MSFAVDPAQQQYFSDNGFVKLTEVFTPLEIALFERDVSAAVQQLQGGDAKSLPNSDSSVYELAFTQVMNIWRHSAAVKQWVFSERVASIAATLLGVESVRLYHDQALYKEAGGGITPWHCDQYYWPLDSDQTITAWIPLQDVTLEMGTLSFSAGSQHIDLGRDLPIGDDSQNVIAQKLRELNLPTIENTFNAGDVSFHGGWTFHCAGANTSNLPRRAMTVIYMADDIRLKQPENSNQEADRLAWCPGVEVGEVVASAINPRLFPQR